MAKKMKKILALVIALALCVGQIVVPAAAETTVTGSGTPEDPKVTVTMTVKSDGSTTTDTNKVWESVDTQTGGSSTEGNPSVEVSTDITTTIQGSEDKNENISPNPATNTEKVSGSLNGQETTVIDGTTVTTTTTTGELIGEEDSSETPITETLPSSDDTTGDWIEGKATDNAWEDDEIKEGTANQGTTVTNSTETLVPTDGEDATLQLTPNGKWVTVTKYIVDLEDIADLPTGEEYEIKELRDNKGNLIGWEVTYEAEEKTTLTNETTKEGTWTQTDFQQNYVKPELSVKEDNDDSDGVTVTIEEIVDGNGGFLGYRIIKTTVTSSAKSEETESARETQTTLGDVVENGFTLPEKPAESESTNKYGDKTTVTVTDLYENGIQVGYTELTVITSAEGAVMYTETRNVYGTASTLKTDVQKDPETEKTTTTTTITTTEVEEIYAMESVRSMELLQERTKTYETTIITDTDTYQLVETEDGMFFLYQGKMWAVREISDENYKHGDVNTTSIQPDISGLEPGSYDETVSDSQNLRNAENFKVNDDRDDGYDFQYVGYGLESAIRVDYGSGDTLVHQFLLVDEDGNEHYVLCADFGTTARRGYSYNMENVDDADYFKNEDAVEHIKAIALNGYWGTTSGVGSLDNIKALLKDLKVNGSDEMKAILKNLTNDDIDALTEGQALAATQAAIWYYGNSDDSERMSATASVTGDVYGSRGTLRNATAQEKENVDTLYKVLINLDPETIEDPTTEFIDKDNFATDASITVKEAVTDDDGNIVTDSNGNKKYNTDLSFTLKVDTTSITGNLKVYVYANGDTENPIATEYLAGDGLLSYGIKADENGTYTISDLELYEGVTITLNLAGTQELEKGVYLYTSEGTSQTFVGISEGEREVNLEVDLVFNVEEPEIKHTSYTTTQQRTDTQSGTKTDSRTDTKNTCRIITDGEVTTEVNHHVDVYGTVTVTETKKDITKEDRSWESFWEYILQLTNDDDGKKRDEDTDIPDEEDTDIPDEEVPLAAAPKTGDISGILAVISLFSLGGMVLLNRKKDEE